MAYTTINKSTDYFNTKLYTGNGVGGRDITGVGFQPDLVWIKRRSAAENHVLNDAVRGVPKNLYSSSAQAEDTGSLMSAIISDGFTVQTDGSVNSNTHTYAAWNWKANGSDSANTAGSINSTVSANTTSGFSIVKFSGTGANATVGHGLGVAPKMIILKSRANAYNWGVYHASIGATKYLRLNSSNAESSASSAYFQNTAPSSTLITLGSDLNINDNNNVIAYCFAEKQGFSKFGSYTGNGNVDGPFIYTGFKPAFIIIKKTSATQSWTMQDNKRNPINNGGDMKALKADNTGAEEDEASHRIDYLSNGFKMRYTWEGNNQSGATYIYMAFAEAPLVGTNNVPCTAR